MNVENEKKSRIFFWKKLRFKEKEENVNEISLIEKKRNSENKIID